MNHTCPISYKQVDEKTARVNAIFSAFTVFAFLMTGNIFVLLFLTFDFLIRGFYNPLYSYYSITSKSILRIFNSKPKLIEGEPKIFAAKLGFLFCSIILLFSLFNFTIIALILSLVLILFNLLEGVLGVCVGCKVFSIMSRYKKTQLK